MGNHISRAPVLIQDNIMSFLSVQDAKNLMMVDENSNAMAAESRGFWLRKAKILHYTDPAAFSRLNEAEDFETEQLLQYVIRSDNMFQEALQNIRTGASEEMTINFEDKIHKIAVDVVSGTIALQMNYFDTHIYSLLRFGDPPLKSLYSTPGIEEMILHGSILFFRPSRHPQQFHTDAMEWHEEVYRTSLGPPVDLDDYLPLKNSEEILLSANSATSQIQAYRLFSSGYDPAAVVVHIPNGEKLVDYAAKEDRIIAITKRQRFFKVVTIDSNNGNVLQRFLLRHRTSAYDPRIAYPYILLAKKTFDLDIQYTISSSVYIPHAMPDERQQAEFMSGPLIHVPTTRGRFAFFERTYENDSRVVPLDSLTSDLISEIALPTGGSYNILSYGLAFIYIENRRCLVYKRFCPIEDRTVF